MSKKPSYTDEFKQDAINLVLEQGYRPSEAARNLGISESALRRWVKVHQENGEPVKAASRSLADVEIENNELRKKLKRLGMERDILKKAAVDSTCQCNTLFY